MTNKERFIKGDKFIVYITDFMWTGKPCKFLALHRNGRLISLGKGAPTEKLSPKVIMNEDNFILDFQLYGPLELKTDKIFFKDLDFTI